MSAHLNAVCVGSFCIDGAHLDSLDDVLTETKKKHTQTGEVSTTNVHVDPCKRDRQGESESESESETEIARERERER